MMFKTEGSVLLMEDKPIGQFYSQTDAELVAFALNTCEPGMFWEDNEPDDTCHCGHPECVAC